MCYSPLLMRSNALSTNVGYRSFNFVSCGDCFQCRTQKATSFYVRATKEMQLYNDPKCMILFVLLTYNEEFLPRVSNDTLAYVGDSMSKDVMCKNILGDSVDMNDNVIKKHRLSKNCPWDDQSGALCNVDFKPLPCFNYLDIDKFFKKLRSRFLKHLGYLPIFSYFLVAENGDTKQRPHYHMMFYINLPKSFYFLCRSIIIDSWTEKVHCPHFVPYVNKDGSFKRLHRDGTPYGYVCKTISKSRGLVFFDDQDGKQFVDPNDPKVSRYLSQYLTTDPYFQSVHHDNLKQLSPRNQRLYIKKFGSFRLTSQFFGISALWDKSLNVSTGKIVVNKGCDHSVDLPIYYYRYVYYTKNEKTQRYERNSNYTKLLVNRIPERYSNLLKSFSRFYDHIKTAKLHPQMFSVYQNYVCQGLSDVNESLFNHSCTALSPYELCDILLKSVDSISYQQLLGYYLLLFTVRKDVQNSMSYIAFECLDYTFLHLDDKEFVFKALENYYEIQENAPKLGDHPNSDVFDVRFVVYESLCVLFSVWLKFDLVTTNVNKFNDWNKKAKSLGKAKYLARPHALAI